MAAYAPGSSFTVEWGGARVVFSDVTGLAGPAGPITLRRGRISRDDRLFSWLTMAKSSQADRRTLVVTLVNKERQPVTVWRVVNAYPVKIEGPQLKGNGNDVAIDSIELASEGLTLVKG